jgi:hypothetical protein
MRLMRDKFRSVRKLIRKLLVLILAAWLPVYTGAAVASIVCQDAGKIGHAHGAEQGTHSTGGAAGVADDCGGCDFCYSHCTLSLPATGYPVAAQGPGAIPQAAAAPLISLSLPPADRPPLSRLG